MLEAEYGVLGEGNASDPLAILRWTLEMYPRVGFTCSFGGTGIVLAHMIGVNELPIPIYFLDTGFLFPETIATRQAFSERYGLTVVDARPALTVTQQAEQHGEELYRHNPDLCCSIRKVDPMRHVLEGLDAWLSGLRRDQSSARENVELLERHTLEDGRVIAKVSPLVQWTRQQAWDYIRAHDLPYNTLSDRGYKSIGCWPCTRAVGDDADEREGRWADSGKTECGLHTFTRQVAP